MSIINTKAGWVCQEDYFVDGTGECGTRNNKVFSKTNDGAAICAKYVYNDTSNIILVSTVESYTAATYDGTTTNIVIFSAVIDDVTWYGTYYSNGADNWITNYPTVTGTVAISSATAEDVISKILITAQAKRDDSLPTGDIVKDLVTVDYVKSLLTNILTENNTRIFRQIDLMELLRYTEQTLTEQQQAQARQNLGITGGGGGSSIDCSTTEQNTGIKWIDGKPIYQRTLQFTQWEESYDATSWNIDKFFVDYSHSYFKGHASGTTDYYFQPIANDEYFQSMIRYLPGAKTIDFRSNGAFSRYGHILDEAYFTILYTKTDNL